MLVFYPLLFILPAMARARVDCSKENYQECIRIADPLIKEPRLIFPDTREDIESVCQTWNRFVDCLKYYTDNCFTEQQRRQFNKAVENPIESVHQMCMHSSYQQEYLKYAPCIKNTITEQSHCGSQYTLLVEQVSQGEIISKSTLCCSYDRFKQCVAKETRRLCDRGAPEGPAARFAGHLIEKALSFLQDQCFNYIPNSGDCSSPTTDSQLFSDPLTISTSSSEVYELSGKEDILPSRVTPQVLSTTTSWLPSSSLETSETSSSHMLGTRTRPASFGRASWSSDPSTTTTQMHAATPTPETRPEWATVAKWSPGRVEEKSTTWYPAAGSQLSNEVDEPNQQGLTKLKNAAVLSISSSFLIVFTVVVLVL